MHKRFFGLVLSLASTGLFAGDYERLATAVHQAWPDRTHAAVFCDRDASQLALLDLTTDAVSQSLNVLILDVKKYKDLQKQFQAAVSRKMDVIIFVSDDPSTGQGTPTGQTIIRWATDRKVPVVATTQEALKAGAVLAIGDGTGGKLMTNAEAARKIGLILPEEPAK